MGGISAQPRAGKGHHADRHNRCRVTTRSARLPSHTPAHRRPLLSAVVPGLEWIAFAIGAGLTVAALTNTCAMGMMLARLPYNQGGLTCDLKTIVDELVRPERPRES